MQKAKIVVLAGQSNAVGVGYTRFLENHFDSDTVKRCTDGFEDVPINYFSHNKKSNGFQKTAVNLSQAGKETFGPEVSLAEALSGEKDEKYFIVKCAFGDTALYHDWLSPSSQNGYNPDARAPFICGDAAQLGEFRKGDKGWCYNELVAITKESIDILENAGYSIEISAFLWMQGESDSLGEQNVDAYIGRYENLLNDFSAEFSQYLGKCIWVDAGISRIWPFYSQINELKKEFAKAKGYRFIDTISSGLTTENEPPESPDIYHYDSDSVIKLGKLFANEIL